MANPEVIYERHLMMKIWDFMTQLLPTIMLLIMSILWTFQVDNGLPIAMLMGLYLIFTLYLHSFYKLINTTVKRIEKNNEQLYISFYKKNKDLIINPTDIEKVIKENDYILIYLKEKINHVSDKVVITTFYSSKKAKDTLFNEIERLAAINE